MYKYLLFFIIGLNLLLSCSRDNHDTDPVVNDSELERISMKVNGNLWQGGDNMNSELLKMDAIFTIKKQLSDDDDFKYSFNLKAYNTNNFGNDFKSWHIMIYPDEPLKLQTYTNENLDNYTFWFLNDYTDAYQNVSDGSFSSHLPFTLKIEKITKIEESDEEIKYRVRGKFALQLKKSDSNTEVILYLTEGRFE